MSYVTLINIKMRTSKRTILEVGFKIKVSTLSQRCSDCFWPLCQTALSHHRALQRLKVCQGLEIKVWTTKDADIALQFGM